MAKKGGLGRGMLSLYEDLPEMPAFAGNQEDKKKEEASGTDSSKKSENVVISANSQSAGSAEDLAVIYINLDDIRPNEMQPRQTFDAKKLEELAQSIKDNGLIQPVVVCKAARGYELVSGERRWRAARIAGLSEIPAIVRDVDEKAKAVLALIENMQRENLSPIEEAEGIDKLMNEYGLNHAQAGKAVGKSRAYVSNSLRLLKLPETVKHMLLDGSLTAGHARAIAGLKSEALQLEAAEKAVKEGWSVRKIESYTGEQSGREKKKSKSERTKPLDILEAEESITRCMGTKVRINGSRSKGKLEIEYYSQDELDRLVELLSREIWQ